MSEQFQGYQVGKNEEGQRCALKQLEDSDLMEGDVTVRVEYTTLNYKDGLALTGRSPVIRKFPLTPGIDFSGTVVESQHADVGSVEQRAVKRDISLILGFEDAIEGQLL